MKKLILKCCMIASLIFAQPHHAQVNINVNLGVQPAWGPVGYDYVEYYYLPDIEMYYSVPARKYIYFHRGQWIWVSTLPSWCRHYDLYSGYKVIINEPRPYFHFDQHKIKYHKYKNYHGKQKVIKYHPKATGGHHHSKEIQGPKGKGNKQHHDGHGKGKGKGHR